MRQLEPVLFLLSGMVVLFTLLLFISEKMFPNDGQIFQILGNLVSGFAGALLMRVKPRTQDDEQDKASQTTILKQITTEPKQ